MVGKRGLLLVVLFVILSLFVSAEENILCDDGSWLSPISNEPDNLVNCTVNENQNLTVNANTKYYADKLTINSDKTLRFFHSSPSTQSCISGGSGGSEWRRKGTAGTAGGGGGCLYKKGFSGTYLNADECTDVYGGSAGKIGAKIEFYVLGLEIFGTLSVAGVAGGRGDDGHGRSFSGCNGACGGAGGGSGGSGGRIIVSANEVIGGGFIDLRGGDGGDGGDGHYQSGGGICFSNAGGGGGGAPGGAGGVLQYVTETFSVTYNVSAGTNGVGGNGPHPAEDGDNPYPQPPQGSFVESLVFENCQTPFDEDLDGTVAMKDSTCYNSCPDLNDPVLVLDDLTDEEAAALNGSDGCCGDDFFGCKGTVPFSCNEFNESDCLQDLGCSFSSCSGSIDTETYCYTVYEVLSQGCPYSYCEIKNYPLYGDVCEPKDTAPNSILCSEAGGCDISEFNSSCSGDVCEGTMTNNDCSQFGDVDYCNSLSSYGCLWLSLSESDYAFFDSSANYFCSDDYNINYQLENIDPNPPADWHWWDAKTNAFKIHSVDLEENSFDVVSNSREWFVCDASQNAPVPLGELNSSNYVEEYGTFDSPYAEYTDGQIPCSDYFNDNFLDIIEDEGVDSFSDCVGEDSVWCCEDVSFPVKDMQNCLNHCFVDYGEQDSFGDYFLGLDWCEMFGFNCPYVPGIQSENEILKEYCGRWLSCFGGGSFNPSNTCENQGSGGHICEGATPYCSSGSIVSSSNTDIETDKVCCVGESASCINYSSDMNCESFGGTVCQDGSSCFGQDVNGCCFGGGCIDFGFEELLNFNDSFICYSELSDSRFGECCYEGKCKNSFKSIPGGSYVGRGTSFHTIKSFDKKEYYGDTVQDASIKDMVFVGTYSHPSKAPIVPYVGYQNWTEFDFLEMAFASNDFDALNELIFVYEDDTSIVMGNFSDFLALNSQKYRWNYVIVDLSSLDSKNVKRIEIALKQDVSNVEVAIDNVKLVETGDSDGFNSENRYCSGGFWIDNMDFSENPDKAFLATPNQKTLHAFTCNVQMSFDWTGNFCCGDDTRFNYGEFFNDSLRGCFNGTAIPNDWTVANATNVYSDENKKLLFYDSSFWSCNESYTVNNSYDGQVLGDLLVPEENALNFFDIKGSWYCADSGWELIENANKMKFIVATLKEIGENEESYSLHCGAPDKVTNIPVGSNDSEDSIDFGNICVLEADETVMIGAAVPSDQVNNFLNRNIKSFYPLDSASEPSSFDCKSFSYEFDALHFFQECVETGDKFNASYNEPFGIILFGLKKDFSSGGVLGFLNDWWQGIINFFSSLFGSQQSSYTPIPEDIEYASFEELYIKKVGNAQIKGVREDNSLVVVYTNLTSDISFLKTFSESLFDDETNIQYEKDKPPTTSNTQILSIIGLEVNDFDWRYLTSNIEFDSASFESDNTT